MQGVIEVGDLLHPQTKQPQEEEEDEEEEWFICTAPTRSRFNVLHILG